MKHQSKLLKNLPTHGTARPAFCS